MNQKELQEFLLRDWTSIIMPPIDWYINDIPEIKPKVEELPKKQLRKLVF